ncbi:MAG: peptide-methionine (R)-S-oxide reductase MsrB [Sulfuricaulis sp.]
MNRRNLLKGLAVVPLLAVPLWRAGAATPAHGTASVAQLQNSWKDLLAPGADVALTTAPLQRTNAEWQKILTPAQYGVLREADTERPFSSLLNEEKRPGVFVCAACRLPLFTSAMKFDSGTGWPSFFTTIPGVFATRSDNLLVYTRTEYHCVRCGGHHGHVFDDGPPPTGQRWCNNGVALQFIPKLRQI